MKKEIEQLKEAEHRFAKRKQLASQTSKEIIDKAKSEAIEEIGRLNHQLDEEGQLMKKEALAQAADEQVIIRAEETVIREKLKRQFEERKERVKEHLTKEVFDIGHR